MNPDDLIRIAEHLASGGVRGRIGRPVQAELRRAVSATYYALFHALSRCCANMLVGATPASRSQQAWRQVYRALEHGHAKNQCSNWNMFSRFPYQIQDFGLLFAAVQRQRQDADYDPYAQFFRSDVLAFIDQSQESHIRVWRYGHKGPTGVCGLCTVQSQTKLMRPYAPPTNPRTVSQPLPSIRLIFRLVTSSTSPTSIPWSLASVSATTATCLGSVQFSRLDLNG